MIATIDGITVQGTPSEINSFINERFPQKTITTTTGTEDWIHALPKTWCQNTTSIGNGTTVLFTTC